MSLGSPNRKRAKGIKSNASKTDRFNREVSVIWAFILKGCPNREARF